MCFFAKMKVKDPIISSWTHNDEILVLVYNSVIWFILVVGLTCEEARSAAESHPYLLIVFAEETVLRAGRQLYYVLLFQCHKSSAKTSQLFNVQ